MTCRFAEFRRCRLERRIWKNGPAQLSENGSKFDPQPFVQSCCQLVVGSQSSELEGLCARFPDVHANLARFSAETAQNILSGKWSMLGHDFDLRGEIEWHRDPRSDLQWERTFYHDISISRPGHDVKYVWEISRHQYLAMLSRGWLLADDSTAADTVQRHLASWISENPVYEGVNWFSALEVAMRAISWAWTVSAMGETLIGKPDLLQSVTGSLIDHANFLEHHLSYYSSPFNHLIGEATGLYLIAFLLPENSQSERWQRLSREVLKTHASRQFYDDGFGVEQAVGYHFYTLGFLSLAIIVARRERQPLLEVEQVVHRAFRAGAAMRQPDGRWPKVGDLDSARSLPVFHNDYWRFGSLCSLGAVLFDDADLIVDDAPSEELYWLIGVTGVEKWKSLTESSADRRGDAVRHSIMEDSGYLVAADCKNWLLFDAGPIAGGLFEDATPSVAHGHADTLQVLYWMDGNDVLSDCGIQSYADRQSADYFRSPAAHNTLEVDGVPIAKNAGKLAWSNITKRPGLKAKLNSKEWLAHGSVELSDDVVVDRYLLGIPGTGIWITDRIRSNIARDVSWYWQLGDGEFQTSQGRNPFYACDSRGVSIKVWSNDEACDLQLHLADSDSPVGWRVADYGITRSGNRLRVRLQCKGSLALTTFVGRTDAQFALQRVAVGGHRIECTNLKNEVDENSQVAPEVEWVIADSEVIRTYVADSSLNTKRNLPGIDQVGGVGNWSVFLSQQKTKSAAVSSVEDIRRGIKS